MYSLINKNTGVIEDITAQPFPVTDDFEWVEDTKIKSSDVKKLYNKETKEITEQPAKPERPQELSNQDIAQKLVELEGKLSKEPILGVGEIQAQDQGFNPLYLLLIPVVVGAYFLGKKV